MLSFSRVPTSPSIAFLLFRVHLHAPRIEPSACKLWASLVPNSLSYLQIRCTDVLNKKNADPIWFP